MERQAYDRLLQESLVRRDTMGGLCRLLHRVFPRPEVLSLEGRQAHMQCTLVKNEIKTRSKRDQTESKTRSKRDHRSHVEDFWIFWAHMCRTRAHKFTHFCTRSHQPTSAPTFRLNFAPADASRSSPPAQPSHTRQPNGKHPRSSTPVQRCTGASQIISTPSSAPAQPCKHARLVQVRGKARCRLEPAVAKETSSLKIAKHTVNAPRRIR